MSAQSEKILCLRDFCVCVCVKICISMFEEDLWDEPVLAFTL